MTEEPSLRKLQGFDLFRPGMTVKSGMEHFAFPEVHRDMEDLTMTKKGNHISDRSVIRVDLPEGILLLLVPVPDAEIRAFIKLYAELPAVKLDNKAPAVKIWVLSPVRRVSDEKVMVKLHI